MKAVIELEITLDAIDETKNYARIQDIILSRPYDLDAIKTINLIAKKIVEYTTNLVKDEQN